jgi:hypothetical protein
LIGAQRPRLSCFPADVQDSLGTEATELAASAGLILDDWQSWSVGHIMGINSFHRWSAFETLEIVGRQNGKGAILEARELAGLFLVPTDVEIIHTAHEYKTARKHFYRLVYLIQNTPDLYKRVAHINESHGQEGIILLPTPTIIMGCDSKMVRKSVTKQLEIIARSKGSGRGFTGDLLVYDEAMILDAVKVGATLPTLSARPNAQVIYMASAGFKTSTQLAKVRRRGIAGKSKSLFYGEWSIDPHTEYCPPDCTAHDEPGTPEAYARSNPAVGIRIRMDYLENEREAFEGGETEWLRERMGVGEYPAPADAWLVIPKKWWNATADRAEQPPRVMQPVFAIGASPDRSSAAIAVAGMRPDGLTGVQVVEHHKGTGWLLKAAKGIDSRWHPVKWIVDPHTAAGSLIAGLVKEGLKVEKLQSTTVAHGCGQLFDGFRDDTLRHYGQDNLRAGLAGVDKRTLSGAWVFDWVNAASDIAPLMAATFAHWGYLMFGPEADYDASESVHFDVDEVIRVYRAGAYGPSDIRRLIDEGLISETDMEALANAGIPT